MALENNDLTEQRANDKDLNNSEVRVCHYSERTRHSQLRRLRSERYLTQAGWLLQLFVLFCLLICFSVGQPRKEPCPNIDIRNKVEYFEPWLNCTVIEGGLQIVLLENTHKDSFNNITFKYLEEITDFLLIYKIRHLRTLSHMFPRLTVIRGNKLYMGNSLTVYMNDHLQDLGLGSLTTILKGGVRVEDNPQLCYINTINWQEIIYDKIEAEKAFFDENMDVENCPPQSSCPSSCLSVSVGHQNSSLRYCWNANTCQRVCLCKSHAACSLEDSGSCCDEECIGGCRGPGPSQCLSCRNWLSNDGMTCVKNCPLDTYQYMRRCVTNDECMKMTSPLPLSEGQSNKETYVPVSEETPYTCEISCPIGYNKVCEDGKRYCKKCKDKCRTKKVCKHRHAIFTLKAAEYFYNKGCTHIGGLIINVQGGPETEEKLRFLFQNVEEVQGYVKIYRSAISSLDILPNLKRIKGETLCCGMDQRNALVIQNNEDLRELWDPTKPAPKIERGGLFFHNNPKLCVKKIKNFHNKAGMKYMSWDALVEREVSNFTNGNKAQCSEQTMNLTFNLRERDAGVVILSWNHVGPNMTDYRNLLGYSIVYRKLGESERTPTTEDYFNNKEDGDFQWVIIDEEPPGKTGELQMYTFIGNLESYTSYAAFVQTFLLPFSFDEGAISNMVRFRTKPSTPSRPEKIIAHAQSSSKLYIRWRPPLFPNGLVRIYRVKYTEQENDLEAIYNRVKEEGKCPSSVSIPTTVIKESEIMTETEEEMFNEESVSLDDRQEHHLNKITFFDSTLGYIYIHQRKHDDCSVYGPFGKGYCNMTCLERKPRPKRHHKRSVILEEKLGVGNSFSELETKTDLVTTLSSAINATSSPTPPSSGIVEVADGGTDVTLDNLKHYTSYLIEVTACQNRHGRCSRPFKIMHRTAPLETADEIRNLGVFKHETGRTVTVVWDKPDVVNGEILSYQIVCTRDDVDELEKENTCIFPKLDHICQSYTLRKELEAGNYIVSVRAWSLSGPANFTTYSFHMPEKTGDL